MTALATLGLAALLALPLACPDTDPGESPDSASEPIVEPAAPRYWSFVGEISAYCHNGITASGVRTQPGVAAAGSQFAIGTRLDIDGIGVVTVLDRGGAITGSRIDVWMSSCPAAIRWGRQQRTVRVLE